MSSPVERKYKTNKNQNYERNKKSWSNLVGWGKPIYGHKISL